MIRFHRGRDAHYWAPAQIPAGVFHAPGLQKRASEKGTFSWGPKNKLALHRAGIPVDLFSATEDNWWNYVVCRPDHTRITFASRQPPSSAAGNGIPTAPASRAGPLAGQREEHKVEILSRPTLFATMGTQLRKGQGPPLWHLSFRKPISVGVGSVSSCSRILLFFINAIFKASVL
jgi:hypothetical protein